MPDVPFLPPGPSPEFLKRQAVMGLPQDPAFTGSFDPIRGNAFAGSFDPSTGVRQGMTVNAPVTPPATSEMQMLEAIRQQVNAMHFKNAQDALNASIQFQHMREAQRMRERGATEEQIMSRLGRGLFYQNNNPYSHARAVSELGPVMSPTVTESGGVKILRYGKGGTQARVVPQSALAPQPLPTSVREIPIEKEDGTISEDEYAVPSASGRGFVVRRRPTKRSGITAANKLSALRLTIDTAQKELKTEMGKTKAERESKQWLNRKAELQNKMLKAQQAIESMAESDGAVNQIKPDEPAPGPRLAPAKPAAPGYTIGRVYKGGLKYLGGDPNDKASWEQVK